MPMYFRGIKDGVENYNWSSADSIVSYIHKFQARYGAEVLPEKLKINLEITINKLGLFSKLFLYYFILGLLLISFVIIQLFQEKK